MKTLTRIEPWTINRRLHWTGVSWAEYVGPCEDVFMLPHAGARTYENAHPVTFQAPNLVSDVLATKAWLIRATDPSAPPELPLIYQTRRKL